MKKVELGGTAVMISCMGLGTMYFGSKVGEQTSFDILDSYVEEGGRFFDSANKYASWVPGFHGGDSESLLGRWMKQRANRAKLFITSKVGLPYSEIPRSLKKDIIISECEKSLKRFGTDTIDLFFAWQLSEANSEANLQGWEGFVCIQQRHSYIEPVMRANFGAQLMLTPELQTFCSSKNLTMMAYSPLLGGAYVREDLPIPDQYHSISTDIRLDRLKKVAEELNVSVNVVILSWMIQGPVSVIPIISGSTVDQVKESLQALSVKLSEAHLDLLNKDIVQAKKY